MAKAPAKPKVALPSDEEDTPPANSQSADMQQELDALLAFDADTKPPIEFTKGTPLTDPGRKRHLTRDDPRIQEAHLLDRAPNNSNIVVTDVGAVLSTPTGRPRTVDSWDVQTANGPKTIEGATFDRGMQRRLPDGDTGHTLPIGSKIVKLGEQRFRATVPGEDGPVEFLGDRVNGLIAEATHFLQHRPTAG